ncbi:hypothetical protein JAAARDRAFT_33094 [Jaapia argillacea MUCL 33604]|uniref:Methyltransferase domain-containing protein n=1 Tax=Jaapia argillacea MUCL 33604 TaxID=933084 RepID=A0A067PXH5_9AGAM|nr:hypothetical protein JAAARDRAFT_33094 [Jaapia argillacea MUCL 33604]
MAQASENYIHGHHPSVLRSHSWRTVQNSAAYLIPYLRPDMSVLDAGCGPGTITIDFAHKYVPQGSVIGIEPPPGDVLEGARKKASDEGVGNVGFGVGDINDLKEFEEGRFDVAHAHQVLQHIQDPVGALREMKRVTKKGGLVATREADFGSFVWYPDSPELNDWREIYAKVARSLGAEPYAGRRLVSWALQAGFPRESIDATAGTWCYSTKEEREWWTGLWADRVVSSRFAKHALEKGLVTQEKLEEWSKAWREWGKQEDAWFCVLHGEIVCRV